MAILTVASEPPFVLRVVGMTGGQLEAIVDGEAGDMGIADRDPGNVAGGDGALVVGEPVGGDAAEIAHGPIKAAKERWQFAVPGGDDHPETGPGQLRRRRARSSCRQLADRRPNQT